MSTSFIRQCLTACALVTSFSIGGVAMGAETEDREIPTQLINTPDATDLNGACSKCRVNTMAAAQGSAQDGATLEIYYADDRGSLDGYVELTVLLTNGTYFIETIEPVAFESGQHVVFELEGHATWSWQDVEHLWVEVVPTVG